MLMEKTLRPATELGGYRVESVLGEGGMGIVYLATQLGLGRHVALKVLAPELAQDEEFRQRFIRESIAAAALDDPNILPVYDAGEAGGYFFISMRHVVGSDLGRILAGRGRLTRRHVLEIVEQIGGALDAAHQAGLVHRDVKPGNILVDRKGIAFLCDFGLATRGPVGADESGLFLGTIDYCSPEQIAGRAVDGRADLYALAAVAYHALAGAPPFERETEVATANAHLDDPLPGSQEIPDALYAVLAKAMAKKPSARYATTADFAEAFAAALDRPDEPTETGAPAPDANGRLTDDVLRARFAESRGALWQRPAEWRLQTRVHRAPKNEGGRLTDTVFRERVEEASRGAVRWRDVKNVKAPPTRIVPVARDASGRLTDDVLAAKVEEERQRRSKPA
jgi:serine/threonine protein kinase